MLVSLFCGVEEEIPALERRKREHQYQLRVSAMLVVVALVYVVSLVQGIFAPAQKVVRIEPLRPPIAGAPFDQRWQNPTCQGCGGEDIDMKDTGKIAPTFAAPYWKIDKVVPMPWYLLKSPVAR
ncbi:hypothetical protein [Bradyrhizobium sp. RT3b]|uniref:hypothetical protein n=1 Tax=Bradyrhizobium sp. RT3b TaxID=3156334 RepID=UPI0033945823